MYTAADKKGFEQTIYSAARAGTTNPGLPDLLAALLVAQAKHETGNFGSNAFTKGNNAFGYSYVPGAKWQTGQPGIIADNGAPVAMYASLGDSTRELVDWIYRRKGEGKFPSDLRTITTPEQYAALLKNSGYYGDTLTNYTSGLKRFFVEVLPGAVKNNPVVSMLILAGVGYVVYKLIRKN